MLLNFYFFQKADNDGVIYEGLDVAEKAIFQIRPLRSEYVAILLKKSIVKFLKINRVNFDTSESKYRNFIFDYTFNY